LHRCCADESWNQRQIFETTETLFERPQHKRMPWLSRHGFDQNRVAVFKHDARTAQRQLQHRGFNVSGEQQIAATAHQKRRRRFTVVGTPLHERLLVRHNGELPRRGRNAKGGERRERKVAQEIHQSRSFTA